MIRINLLPVREARRKADIHQQLLMIAVSAGAAIVIAGGMHTFMRGRISDAKERVASLNQQLEKFKPQQAQVDAFKAKKAEITQKLEVIQRLERSRSGPVHILDELATRTPERVWLTDLKANNGRIEIQGMSLDNELVALFLTSLNESKYFANVELKATELKTIDAFKLNTFRVVAQLESPDAPAAPNASGAAPAAGNTRAKPASAPARRAPAQKEG